MMKNDESKETPVEVGFADSLLSLVEGGGFRELSGGKKSGKQSCKGKCSDIDTTIDVPCP